MEENQSPQMTPDMEPETTMPPEQSPAPSLEATPTPAPVVPSPEPTAPAAPVVPVMPAPQPMAMETPPAPQKKKSSRLIIGGVIAAAIVLLGGGSALAYTQWYQNPDKVVHDAIIKAVEAKSASMTGDISYKAKGVDIKLALDSKSKAPNGELNAKATVALDTDDFKHTFTADGSVRVVGDTVYVKLSGIQKIVDEMTKESSQPIPDYVTTIVGKIDNKWLSIKASDYEDTSKEISEQQKCLTKLAEKMQSDKAMMNEVTKLYKEHQIIIVKEQLGSKTIDGVGSLGYEIGADKDATVAFVKGLGNTTLGKEMKSCNKDIDFDEMAKDITSEGSSNSKAEGKVELWVSRFGHEITEVAVNGKDDDMTFGASLRPIFNKDVTVEAPKDATPIKTLIEDIQSAVTDYYMNAYTSESMYSDDALKELSAFQGA